MEYPDDERVHYNYNSRMLLESVIGTSTYVSSTTYDSAGRMDLRTFGNGTQTDYTYYPWTAQGGRLQTFRSGTTGNPTSLQDLAYAYDAVGNISQITNSIASETNTYGYDTLNRLTSWTLNGVTENYSYNPSTGNLETKGNLTLQYNDAAHKHAVTNAGTNTYQYDANGNQTTRVIGSDTLNLIYDAENRLVEVKKNDNVIATFVYDGDGRRVKSVMGSETILFVGGHYEIKNPGSGQEVTKYYFAGALRIAIRKYTIPQSQELNYLLGDHLGSTSLTTDDTGNLLVETRYKAWGEVRYTTPNQTLPTRYTYTGQYSYINDEATDLGSAGFGLMFYNARWYDPALGRFAQADTIIPGGVQGYDRYAYVNNSPIRYTDPSGHKVTCEVDENCKQSQRLSRFTGTKFWKALIKDEFGITMSEENDYNNPNAKTWDVKNLMTIFNSLSKINVALNGKLKSLVGGATFKWGEHDPGGGNTTYHGLTYGRTISFFNIGNAAIRQVNIFHEFRHLIDNSPGMVDVFSRDPGINNPDFLDNDGYLDTNALVDQGMIQHSYSINTDDQSERLIAQQEHWADIFANYVAGNIDLSSPQGSAMNTFVTGALAPYIGTP